MRTPYLAVHCLAVAAAIAWPACALAQFDIVPVALTQYERSSNEAETTGDTFRSDLLRIAAGFESQYQFGRQELFADALYGKVSYEDVADFNDDEWALRGGMNWFVTRYFDGMLEAVDNKQIPSTPDRLVTGNSVEEERRLRADVNALFAERWRLETSAISRSLETPIVEIPNFGVRETIQKAAFRYLTAARLSFGVEYENIDGNFRNAPELATYTQKTPAAFVHYTVPDLNTLQLRIGRTEREQASQPASPFEETTGDFSIERVLTGKTAVNVQGARRIDNYFGPDAGAFALIGTWNVGVNWKVTDKSMLYVDYGQTRTEFLGDGVAGQIVDGREDDASTINVSFESEPLKWLTTELYLRHDDVDSNIDVNSFTGLLIGLKLEARFLD